MPSSAVPNTDRPGPPLPETDLPEAGLPETGLPETGLPEAGRREAATGSGPVSATGSGPDDGAPGPSATLLLCGGCGTSAVIDQDEHRYGGLVRSFLGDHSECGNAVQITRTQPRND